MYSVRVTLPAGLDRQLIDLRNRDRITRAAALNLLALISERIQQRGELTDGGKIGGGQYVSAWRKVRQKKGRQTAYVDLTFNGGLLDRSFAPVLLPDGWGLGFADGAAPIAEGLTAYFGAFAEANDAEMELAFRDILNEVNLILN